MLGEGDSLSKYKELTEILWFMLPLWYRAMAMQARFDFATETFLPVLSYFTRFQVIESMVNQAKGFNNKKPTMKPRAMKKSEAAKVTCGFCKKNEHSEDVC